MYTLTHTKSSSEAAILRGEAMSDRALVERTAIRKVTVTLLPFLMLAYLVSFIDRVNLGFAALQMNREVGLTSAMFGHGWQWLFLLEGLPSVLLGLLALRVLPKRPADARWLTAEEKTWLEQTVTAERLDEHPVAASSIWRVMFHPQVLLLSLVYAGSSAASNGLSLWQPQILKAFGLTDMQTGLLNSVPFLLAAIVMILWSRRSDRLGERVWSTALPLGISAAALACCLWTSSLTLTVVLLSATLIGTYPFKGPFWALSTETLSAGAAAAGLAQVNAIGNLAGFGGTALIGVIRDATHSYPLALLPLVILEAIGCVVVVAMGRRRSRHAVLADVA